MNLPSLRRTAVMSACLALAGAVPAVAATKNGITPTSPRAGATIPVGQSPTFKGRVKGAGVVYVHVCKSRKRNAKGVICDDEAIKKARRKGGRFTMKAEFFDFPAFWLNSPGTYYWQAHRIRCEGGNVRDCLQEGPITKLTVA